MLKGSSPFMHLSYRQYRYALPSRPSTFGAAQSARRSDQLKKKNVVGKLIRDQITVLVDDSGVGNL